MRFNLYFGAAALAMAAPASAAWQQASSKHFIIYGDMPAEEMKAYATKLETFDAAARLVRSMPDPDLGDENRLQVFLVSDLNAVGRLVGSIDYGIAGYFMGSVTGPVAVVPEKMRKQHVADDTMTGEQVFFHEYTHSLQLQNTSKPLPQWLSEGFAEFMANPIFGDDGSIGLGTPATHRTSALVHGRRVPLSNLLGNKVDTAYDRMAFYTQGWVLTHYLSFDPNRRGQIDRYVTAINDGKPPVDAARNVFGDLGALEAAANSYIRQKQLPFLKIEISKLKVAPVTVTELTPGGQAVLPHRIRLKAALDDNVGRAVVSKVRAIAERHPNDPLVLRTLAEAEFKAENYDAAVKAADLAITANPKSVEARVTKGEALMELAKQDRDAGAFTEARKLFLAANRIDKEDPQPLYLYYRSYIEEGAQVTKMARDAVHYAAVLTPQDPEVQARSAIQHLRDNQLDEAKARLASLAFSPHRNKGQKLAKDVYDLIEAGKREEAIALAEKKLAEVLEED